MNKKRNTNKRPEMKSFMQIFQIKLFLAHVKKSVISSFSQMQRVVEQLRCNKEQFFYLVDRKFEWLLLLPVLLQKTWDWK